MEIWDVNFSTLNTSTLKCNGWPSKITHTDNLTNGIYKADGMGDYPSFSINAVDIDWNGALMIFNSESVTFNNTGDLLKYIQDLHDEVINNEKTVAASLNELNNRVGLSSGNVDLSDYVNLTTTSPQTIKSNIVLKNGLAILDESDPDDRYLIAKFYSDAGDGIEFYHTTNFYDAVNFNNSNLYLNGYSLIRKETLTGSKNCLVINDYESDYKMVAIEADDLYIAKKSVESGKGTANMYKIVTTETTNDIYNKLRWIDNSDYNYLTLDSQQVLGIKLNEIVDYEDNNIININTGTSITVGDNYLDLKLLSLSNPTVNVNNTEQTLLHTGNLSLNYADNQLSLKSGSTILGNPISLSNINGNVKVLQVEQRSNTDNTGINYNNNPTNLTDLIYKQCADGISIIKVTPTLDKNYSSLNCVVNFIGQESDYKYFEISGPLVYSQLNNKFAFPSSSMDAVYGKWVVKIGKDSDITILKNLGNDNRTKANIEISDLSSTEVYPGESTLIIIKSNISGNISINTQNTSYYNLEVIKLSNTSNLIKITNTNISLSLQVINKDFISVSFTPTDTDLYLPSKFTINNQAINIYGVSLTDNAIIYPLHIDSKTKSLINSSTSGDIYTNSNNRSIIAVNKRSSETLISFDSDKTYYPDNISIIQIDDFAAGLSYDVDFYEEYRSPLENIATLKILVNNTIKGQFDYKWNDEESDNTKDIVLNKYNYKNLIIRIPSCGISGTSEIEIFPKSIQYRSRRDLPRIKSYVYNHTNNNFVTLGSYNNSSDRLLTAELYEHNWMDYSVKYTVNENTTSQFRIINLLVTTNTSGISGISSIKDTDQTCLLCFVQEPKSYTRIYYGKLSSTSVSPEDMNLFSSKIINGNTSINIKIDEKVNKYDKIVVLVPDNVQFKNNFTKSNLIIYWDNLQYSVYTSNIINSSTDFNLLFS